MHWFGIPAIFFAVLVILAACPVPIGHHSIALGTLLLIPATILWLALDARLGSVLVIMVVPLAAAAEWVAWTSGITAMLLIASGAFTVGWISLIVGHIVFEHRKPALVDDISLMFIGPMFIVAKALVAFGLRPDLASCMNGTDARQV